MTAATPHARLEEMLAHAHAVGSDRWGVHVPDHDVRLLLREHGDVLAELATAQLRLVVTTDERDHARDALAGLIEGQP